MTYYNRDNIFNFQPIVRGPAGSQGPVGLPGETGSTGPVGITTGVTTQFNIGISIDNGYTIVGLTLNPVLTIENKSNTNRSYSSISLQNRTSNVAFGLISIIGTHFEGAGETRAALTFGLRPAEGQATITERMRIMTSGEVLIGNTTSLPTSLLDIAGNNIRLRTSNTPTDPNSGNTGDIRWDDNFIYIRTSTGWKTSGLTTL